MDRPYIQFSIFELIDEVESNHDDLKVLAEVLIELSHRKSSKAHALQARIIELIAVFGGDGDGGGGGRGSGDGKGFRPYPWQMEALRRWQSNNSRGIVEAVTGAGKTIVGLMAIKKHLASGGAATVVVPTVELLYQWQHRLEEFVPDADVGLLGDGHKDGPDTCDVLISTIHSAASKFISCEDGRSLLIADEVHRFAAETFRQALEDRFDLRLGLSATWQREDGLHEEVLEPYFGGVVFTLNYRRAREEGAICPFRMALVAVDLEDDERQLYEAASVKISRLRRRLIKDFGATDGSIWEFMAWVNRASRGAIPGAERAAGFYLSAVNQRRKILSETDAKLDCAVALQPSVRAADRTIGFTLTIESAERIASAWKKSRTSAAVFHSNLAKVERARLFHEFRTGKVQALVAPKVLDEGIDVPDADLAIIIATSRSRVQLTQRVGRVLRRKPDDSEARIVLLYVRNTAEDPESGTHEDVLRDLEDAADEIEWFDFPDDAIELNRFLEPLDDD